MSKERDLLLVALDFLDPRRWLDPSDQHVLNIISRDIEELLAQPEQEQEPVAWMLIDKETGARIPKAYKPEHGVNKDRWELYPLFASPPTREPLSDEEICEILLKKEWRGFVELVRIIEKAHGIGGGE